MGENEIMEVAENEVIEGIVEDTAKTFDTVAFAEGVAGGATAAAGIYLLVKKVIIPGVRKLRDRISAKKAAKNEASNADEGNEEVQQE